MEEYVIAYVTAKVSLRARRYGAEGRAADTILCRPVTMHPKPRARARKSAQS